MYFESVWRTFTFFYFCPYSIFIRFSTSGIVVGQRKLAKMASVHSQDDLQTQRQIVQTLQFWRDVHPSALIHRTKKQKLADLSAWKKRNPKPFDAFYKNRSSNKPLASSLDIARDEFKLRNIRSTLWDTAGVVTSVLLVIMLLYGICAIPEWSTYSRQLRDTRFVRYLEGLSRPTA